MSTFIAGFIVIINVIVLIALYSDIAFMPVELLIQYSLHLFIILFFVSLLLLLIFRRKILVLSLLLSGLGVFLNLNVYSDQKLVSCDSKTTNLRVMTFNILHTNRKYESLYAHIKDVDPDIILMHEVKSGFYNKLQKKLEIAYPYHFIELEKGKAQGLAFYSKYPIDNAKRLKLTPIQVAMEAKIDVDNKKLHFIGLHTPSPRNTRRISARNNMIKATALYVQDKENVIVAGDFNTVPFQKNMRSLQKDGNLQTMNLKDYLSIIGTWPSQLISLFQVHIDHIYYKLSIENVSYHKGLSAGSDHHSLYADFAICKN